MSLEIPKLGDLLNEQIYGDIVNQSVSRLTAPGENFGSLMLKVDVAVKNNDKEEIVYTVAKCVPPNKEMQKIFNIQTTFKNEIGWYTDAIPTLLEFQKEQSVTNIADIFMNIYGARHSLNPNSSEVDEGGVILCENLNIKGFKNVDRRVGFNYDQSIQIIKSLATFHALSLSLKLQKPEVFNQKVKCYLHNSTDAQKRFKIELFQAILQTLKDNTETAPLTSRVEEKIKQFHSESEHKDPREPWATAIHTDFWVNNIMLKDEEENTPKVIILDLQMCGFGSPVVDLIFFLGTSVETPIAEKHFDDFIKLYYEELVDNLKTLNADTTLFSYESFEREIELEVSEEFVHCLVFIAIILAEKGSVGDVTKTEFNPEEELKNMFFNISEVHKKKYAFLCKQFAKRNWI